MQGDRRQPGHSNQAAEVARQPVRPHLAGPRGEHVPGLGPAGPGGALGQLAGPVLAPVRDYVP
jgi:hypothetical protein